MLSCVCLLGSSDGATSRHAQQLVHHPVALLTLTTLCPPAAGFVDDVDVEQGEQVLGWFVHRAGPKHNASARERTVTAGLAAHMPDGMPVLFGVLYVFGEHGGATITFEQKIYEQVVLLKLQTQQSGFCRLVA